MEVGGYGKVIVDLAGISFASPKIPIVYGHIVKCGIGRVEKSEIRDGALVLEGVVSRQTEYAKDFTSSAKNGFPWQASIGGTPLEVEFLNDDATAVVNGRTVDASVAIIRKISLYETSVVKFGADGATSSTIKNRKPRSNRRLTSRFRRRKPRRLEPSTLARRGVNTPRNIGESPRFGNAAPIWIRKL